MKDTVNASPDLFHYRGRMVGSAESHCPRSSPGLSHIPRASASLPVNFSGHASTRTCSVFVIAPLLDWKLSQYVAFVLAMCPSCTLIDWVAPASVFNQQKKLIEHNARVEG
jgi:hypothetical protein